MEKDIINVNDDVFKYLDPCSNDKLSDMDGADLLDLIVLINDYYLQLRKKLGISENATFGLELECENTDKAVIRDEISSVFHNVWITKSDGTLSSGAEVVSPILRNYTKTWQDLKTVCDIISPLASIDTRSGGHIHIGTQSLGSKRDDWLNFIKLWSSYENIIFRFAYGNYLTARPGISGYAKPVSTAFWYYYEEFINDNIELKKIIAILAHNRYIAVNFKNINIENIGVFDHKNTIEFRCPNGSLDPVIWQNNVNLFVNLLEYAKSSNFDDDLVEKRHKEWSNKYNELKWYNQIFLEQALELCDMIFDNNLDKVYFLKQYLKEYQVCDDNTEFKKAPALTKIK